MGLRISTYGLRSPLKSTVGQRSGCLKGYWCAARAARARAPAGPSFVLSTLALSMPGLAAVRLRLWASGLVRVSYRCLVARPELEPCFGVRAWYWPLALGLALLPLNRLVALKCLGLMPKLPIGWLRSLAVQVRWPSWPGACLEGCCRLGRCLSFERFLPLEAQGVL